MDRIIPWLLVWALAAAGLETGAVAQTRYALPEPARPATGDTVRVRLMSGAPFAGETPVGSERSVRLQRLWRSGRAELQPGQNGEVATFRPTEPGVQLIVFFPRDDSDPGRGVASFGKALVVVGRAARGEQIWRSEVGQRLEIVPETDPVALAESGGPFQVQVLFRREPLAGAVVVAVAEDARTDSYRRGVTDALGRVRFDLDRPGRWLIHLAHKSFERGRTPGWTLSQSTLLLDRGPWRSKADDSIR